MNPMQLLSQLMQNNPNIANNPESQRMLNVLQNGSREEQKQLAEELCKARGVNPEEAFKQAKSFFNF